MRALFKFLGAQYPSQSHSIPEKRTHFQNSNPFATQTNLSSYAPSHQTLPLQPLPSSAYSAPCSPQPTHSRPAQHHRTHLAPTSIPPSHQLLNSSSGTFKGAVLHWQRDPAPSRVQSSLTRDHLCDLTPYTSLESPGP